MTRELEPAIAADEMKQFLKLHLGRGWYDTPDLPGRAGYRAVAACRCGDTAEYWLTRSVLSPRRFLEAAAAAPVKAAPARTWWPPARKAA